MLAEKEVAVKRLCSARAARLLRARATPCLIGAALITHLPALLAAQEDRENRAPGTMALPEIFVLGRAEDLTGIAESAAQGRVSQAQFKDRPLLRPGEVLEVIPGLIATQHSGTGKANQYFLRGFNLDHGADFAASVDGVPVNLPTHAHGQGYLDLNFLIPELVEVVEFKKGPYYPEVGDFSSAGAAQINLMDRLPRGTAKLGIGQDNFYRGVVADSSKVGEGDLLYGLEAQYYDGPWDNPENGRKFNGLLKHSTGSDRSGASLSALAYYSEWDSTDQIPRRAVGSARISRFGTIDSTDGGEGERYTRTRTGGTRAPRTSSRRRTCTPAIPG